MGERWERKRQRPCEQQKADDRAAEVYNISYRY
jgi:hypothetical protein